MAVGQRLSKVARECNVGISTIVEFLHKKGIELDMNPNTKVDADTVELLKKEFRQDQSVKKASEELIERKQKEKKEAVSIETVHKPVEEDVEDDKVSIDEIMNRGRKGPEVKVVGKVDLSKPKPAPAPAPVKEEKKEEKPLEEKKPVEAKKPAAPKEPEHISMKSDKPAEAPKVVGKIELDAPAKAAPKPAAKPTSADAAPSAEKAVPEEKKAPAPEKPIKTEPAAPVKEEKKEDFMPTQVRKLSGPTVVGKIDLPVDSRNGGGSAEDRKSRRKKRKRIKKDKEKVNIAAVGDKAAAGGDASRPARPGDRKPGQGQAAGAAKKKAPKVKKRPVRAEVSEEDVARQIKDTLARLTTKGKSKASRHRRDKRDMASQRHQAEMERMDEEKQTIKATEFVTANELANMMDVPVTQIIASCMSLGLFVSINQRLDAETIALVSEEFGFKVEFVSADVIDSIVEEEDDPADLQERPAIVTVMGHVDHGKTSLLDYIRKADVTAGEAGGITQNIGGCSVKLESGRQITFLDTPGHEAFTAMRARGAQVTDIAIIIVAANDNVMPQTVEAINHATAAGVPIVFAINKIDVPGANPDKVREELANMNYLVEDWGGKYQSQEISAKHGTNIKSLLEKVLLEADLLELKANPNKPAVGSV